MKKGDSVRCVDHGAKPLVFDAVYQVVDANASYITVGDHAFVRESFIPWVPRTGDWFQKCTRGYSDCLRPVYITSRRSAGQDTEDWWDCVDEKANGVTGINVKRFLPVLGRSPGVQKPREFRVGDVVECLPDSNRLATNCLHVGKKATILELLPKDSLYAVLSGIDITWSVRSLKLIRAVEEKPQTPCEAAAELLDYERAVQSLMAQKALAPKYDPDDDAWSRFVADRMAAFKRDCPPLDAHGKPMMKPIIVPICSRGMTNEDIQAEIDRRGREARRYAGWPW